MSVICFQIIQVANRWETRCLQTQEDCLWFGNCRGLATSARGPYYFSSVQCLKFFRDKKVKDHFEEDLFHDLVTWRLAHEMATVEKSIKLGLYSHKQFGGEKREFGLALR